MIELRVGNIWVDIVGDLPTSHWYGIKQKLAFRPAGFMHHPLYNQWVYNEYGVPVRRKWPGWKYLAGKTKKRTYFPTGLYSLVAEYLKEHFIKYSVRDLRVKPCAEFPIDFAGLQLRDYQERVCNDAANQQRGIIQAATGAGKTAIAAGLMQKLKVSPFLFFVTSVDLLEQARDSLTEFLTVNGEKPHIGQIGAGVIDIQDINVLTVQTAVRALGKEWNTDTKFDSEDEDDPTPIERYAKDIQDLMHSAQGCICDEVQHWRADTCQLIARELNSAFYTYGMSATPYRDEGDDMMINACFGKKVAMITASELIQKGWLIKPNIKMVHIRGKRSNYREYQSIYKEKVVEDDYYNGTVANIANAYIGNERLVLVLVQQINHGKRLREMIPGSVFLSGNSAKGKRRDTLNSLRRKQIRCIISTTIFDEGIDVKPLDAVLLAGQGKSKVRAMQRIGRILRPYTDPDTGRKKNAATAIDFVIHQKHLEDHAVEREKMYRTEPEFCIEDIDPALR
jgi:superfamily II DNA or RNA helicase